MDFTNKTAIITGAASGMGLLFAQILSELVEKVWPKVESGEVKPTIYKVLPISEAEAAHEILYKGQNVGKVVLTL